MTEQQCNDSQGPSFPYDRVPLAKPAQIKQFLEKWRPVFVAGTTAMEEIDFGEELWALGFIYDYTKGEKLLRSMCDAPAEEAMAIIAREQDILAVGDAIFYDWRSMVRSEGFFFIGSREYFIALLDRLGELAEQLPAND